MDRGNNDREGKKNWGKEDKSIRKGKKLRKKKSEEEGKQKISLTAKCIQK